MLLGDAEHRMLLNIGVTYNRRLHLGNIVNWQYSGEILPVALESDPLTRQSTSRLRPPLELTLRPERLQWSSVLRL